jgi:hypothetical protein
MAYSTQREALAGGEIIYGTGRVSVIRSGNGFNYWPKQDGVAMDAVSNRVVADSLPTKSSSIDIFAERIADKLLAAQEVEEMNSIERQVKAAMFDNAEEEQAAMGTFSSEDDKELERGEVTGNDSTSFEDALAASTKASADYWKRVNAKNAERNKQYGNKPVALDSVAVNAKASRSFSLFDTAKTIIKRQRKSA